MFVCVEEGELFQQKPSPGEAVKPIPKRHNPRNLQFVGSPESKFLSFFRTDCTQSSALRRLRSLKRPNVRPRPKRRFPSLQSKRKKLLNRLKRRRLVQRVPPQIMLQRQGVKARPRRTPSLLWKRQWLSMRLEARKL